MTLGPLCTEHWLLLHGFIHNLRMPLWRYYAGLRAIFLMKVRVSLILSLTAVLTATLHSGVVTRATQTIVVMRRKCVAWPELLRR